MYGMDGGVPAVANQELAEAMDFHKVVRTLARPLKPMASSWRNFTADTPPKLDVNVLLHHSRSAFLRRMPPGARVLCSAGCSGSWYFEWVERCYGRVEKHIGVECYSPRPEKLPDNVEWINNTVSDMSGVADRKCDLVFSGQNLEHLWPDEVIGFLLESWRILRPGGALVIDSPNRELTRPLNWSHPEHTVEITVPEARRLTTLAGFDVTKIHGIWLSRDPRSGRLLSFDPTHEDTDWSLPERLITAQDDPENAFIWWLEASRANRPPSTTALREAMNSIFAEAWSERIQRLNVGAGHVEQRGDAQWVVCSEDQGGAMIYGPNMPLRAGAYRVNFTVAAQGVAAPNTQALQCEVFLPSRNGPLASRLLSASDLHGETSVSLDFTLDQLEFGVQFRCVSLATMSVACRKQIDLLELSDSPRSYS
jgi:SAM-dependent methyltransferase